MTLVGTPLDSDGYSTTDVFGYTSESRIKALYSQHGYTNILDDLSDADRSVVLNQFIRDAEQTIIGYLSRFFESETMADSGWIQSRATWIAAYMISKRRGNEHYFEDLYETALRELTAMATGELTPVQDIPLRSNSLPSMSNHIVDDKFSSAKIRVKQNISIGDTYPGQDISINPVDYAP